MPRSSEEVEFRAIALDICELWWLKIILKDLKIGQHGSMKLYCEKKSTINIAYNPVQHDWTKHVEMDRHFIKEKLESGLICTAYVSTNNQLADISTKELANPSFHSILGKLGMENISCLAWGRVLENLGIYLQPSCDV